MADRNFIVGGWPIIIQQSETGKRTRVIIQSSSDYTTRKPSCLIRKTGSNRVPFIVYETDPGCLVFAVREFSFSFFWFPRDFPRREEESRLMTVVAVVVVVGPPTTLIASAGVSRA